MNGGSLCRLDLATENASRIPITLGTDLAAAIPHFRDVRDQIARASLPFGRTGPFYLDWVKSRMAYAEKLSGEKIGYIHLPDTAQDGNRMLQTLFYSQASKPALIVDDRYNGGGSIPVPPDMMRKKGS
jgi:tricorn protease